MPARRGGLDRRRFMDHAHVVEQQQRQGSVRVKRWPLVLLASKMRFRRFHMFARHQQDGDESTPSRCALPGGAADACACRCGIGALPHTRVAGLLRRAHFADGLQQLCPSRLRNGGGIDGLEHPHHAAMQGIVFHRLPVAAMRRLLDATTIHHEAGMATAAIAPAVEQE